MNEMQLAILLYEYERLIITDDDGNRDVVQYLPKSSRIYLETVYATGEMEQGEIDFATYVDVMTFAIENGSTVTDWFDTNILA